MGKFTTLDKSALTKDWPLDERSALAHFLEEVKLAEGQSIFAPLDTDRGLYFFESGSVRLMIENQILDLKEGETFGELSLVSSNAKLISAISVRESTLWYLSFEAYAQLKKAAPVVSLRLAESILQKLSLTLGQMLPPPKTSSGGSVAGSERL